MPDNFTHQWRASGWEIVKIIYFDFFCLFNRTMQEKYQRLKNLKKLCETEEMLCKRLDMPAHDAGIVEVPTMKQLNEIEENIKYMENQLV